MLRNSFILCFVLIILCSIRFMTCAQELRCNVIVNDQQVQTQERQIITQMRDAISQFMNTTEWTTDKYREVERIKCNILITLGGDSDVSQGRYTATVQIQSSRPIYGADIESPILTFFDRSFSFEYQPSQPLIFAENAYTTNLTAMLAYYAYVILAFDYDSFSNLGGSPILQRILNILNNSQQANFPGWTSADVRNRYWLSENLNNPQFNPFREGLYQYHRLAMDNFAKDPEGSRKKIVEVLLKLKQVNQVRPNAIVLNAFFDSKADELLNIFSEGDPSVIKQAVEILVTIDPTNASKYRTLIK
ncbi:MAG: DUF4835 family protein [Thermoflexibacter sp.]|nr:DUF4835 family protein [Thermoflexibacter sp.]